MVSMHSPDVYLSVKRWLKRLQLKSRSSNFGDCETRKAAMFWLTKYVNWLKKCNQNAMPDRPLNIDPDRIILSRKETVKSEDEASRRLHEEYVEDFAIYLQNVKTKKTPNGYAPKSIATGIGLIRSFYKTNYYALKEVTTPPSPPIREFKVPTKKELSKMCRLADPIIGTWMKCQKDCGLRINDLLSMTFDRKSREFGTIEKQLKNGQIPVHVEFGMISGTGKTGQATDTFFGPNAIDAINKNITITRSGRIFKTCKTSIQQRIKSTAIRAKVGTKTIPVTSHCLRKFFNTRLKLDEMQNDLVERMMGHSIGAVRSAYLNTPVSELAEVYMKHYSALDLNVTKSSPRESTLDILKKYLPAEVYATVTQDL